MKIIKKQSTILGNQVQVELMEYSKSDIPRLKIAWKMWLALKMALRFFQVREPNLPEGISEILFCLATGSTRLLSAKGPGQIVRSFDTYNVQRGRAEQIKATSVDKDLTSFGPRSQWEDIYFLDFYNGGNLDGTFDIYLLKNEDILKVMVNKKQTFVDQQKQGKRPRFSIKEKIIAETKLVPFRKDVKLW